MKQSTNNVLMIKPVNFYYNQETAYDNQYQNKTDLTQDEIQIKALNEFNNLVKVLENEGINVNIFEDTTTPYTPDSIFPNNWFSTHDGTLIIYPMYAQNRQKEVNKFKLKLIDLYNPIQVFDFTKYAINKEAYLEGTGAMVLDRVNKIAYSTLSQRAYKDLFEKVAKIIDYKPIYFVSHQLGKEIYHTNVLMSITSDFVIIAPNLIDEEYRNFIINELKKNHEIIELNEKQILNFAGNCLELEGKNGKFLIMSKTAYNSLSDKQISKIEEKLKIINVDISTIENLGGGSVRCMIAELF